MSTIKKLKSKKTRENINRLNEEWEAEVKVKRARFINEEIEDLYNIKLLQCCRCSSIISLATNKPYAEIVCKECGFVDEECHFPDLFY